MSEEVLCSVCLQGEIIFVKVFNVGLFDVLVVDDCVVFMGEDVGIFGGVFCIMDGFKVQFGGC